MSPKTTGLTYHRQIFVSLNPQAFELDGRYQLVPRCKGLNDLATSMARVRFLMYLYETERRQDRRDRGVIDVAATTPATGTTIIAVRPAISPRRLRTNFRS
jgi:hypothetical protein